MRSLSRASRVGGSGVWRVTGRVAQQATMSPPRCKGRQRRPILWRAGRPTLALFLAWCLSAHGAQNTSNSSPGAVGVNVSNLNASNITVNGTYAPTSSPTPAPTGSPTNVPYSNNERLAWPSTAIVQFKFSGNLTLMNATARNMFKAVLTAELLEQNPSLSRLDIQGVTLAHGSILATVRFTRPLMVSTQPLIFILNGTSYNGENMRGSTAVATPNRTSASFTSNCDTNITQQYLNLTGGYMYTGNVAQLVDYTMELWVNFGEVERAHSVLWLDIGSISYDPVSPDRRQRPLRTFTWDKRVGGQGSMHVIDCPKTMVKDEWHHIAATADKRNELQLFVDGVLLTGCRKQYHAGYVYNRYYADLVGTSSVMSLDRFEKRGETSPDAPLGGPFIGLMDEIRIWSKVRTQAELLEFMYTGLQPNEAGPKSLQLLWNFDYDNVENIVGDAYYNAVIQVITPPGPTIVSRPACFKKYPPPPPPSKPRDGYVCLAKGYEGGPCSPALRYPCHCFYQAGAYYTWEDSRCCGHGRCANAGGSCFCENGWTGKVCNVSLVPRGYTDTVITGSFWLLFFMVTGGALSVALLAYICNRMYHGGKNGVSSIRKKKLQAKQAMDALNKIDVERRQKKAATSTGALRLMLQFKARRKRMVNLPPGWQIQTSRTTGSPYFYNTLTGASQLTKPTEAAKHVCGIGIFPQNEWEARKLGWITPKKFTAGDRLKRAFQRKVEVSTDTAGPETPKGRGADVGSGNFASPEPQAQSVEDGIEQNGSETVSMVKKGKFQDSAQAGPNLDDAEREKIMARARAGGGRRRR